MVYKNACLIIIEPMEEAKNVSVVLPSYLDRICKTAKWCDGVLKIRKTMTENKEIERVEIIVEIAYFETLMKIVESVMHGISLNGTKDAIVYDYVRVYSKRKNDQIRIEHYMEEYRRRVVANKSGEINMNTESKTEMKKNVKPKQKSRYENIVTFSSEMNAYKKEFRLVIQSLKTIDAQGLLFDNSILVAIDEGWGLKEFAQMIHTEIKEAFKLRGRQLGYIEEKYIPLDASTAWAEQQESIRDYSEYVRREGMYGLLLYDLGDAALELAMPAFRQRLSQVKKLAKDIMVIFHIPYMNKKAVEKYKEALEDVMSVRLVQVPPISMEKMVIYLKERLGSITMEVDESATDLLEQWICQERTDGVFYGYDTLDKMAAQIIYLKATTPEIDMKTVTAADVQKMLVHPIVDGDAYMLLNDLIGMAQVKSRVREIVSQIKLQKILEEQGKKVDKPSLHMLFIGNPGTGKTTVARIIGHIFRQEGFLQKGHFIEVNGGDFGCRYAGQTVEKVRTLCKDSYGSVLFIDEAYGMSVGHAQGNLTDEILPTLVAEMENHRDDMCVIMAGYQEEMEEFLRENPGLKSRIPHVIEFPNYTKEELMEIFFAMLEGGFKYEEDFKEALCEYIHNIPKESFDTKEFSNGRFVRNMYEALWRKAAYRIDTTGEKEIVLKKEDMVCFKEEESLQDMVTEKKKAKRIGFVV